MRFILAIFLSLWYSISLSAVIFQDDFNYTGSPTAHGWSYSGSAVEVGSWGKTGNGVRIRYTSQNTAPYELSKSVSSLNLSEVYVEFDFKVPTNAVGGAKFLKLFGKKNAPVGVANTTFGLLYSNTTFKEISYGTGDTSTTNDTATIIYYNGVYEPWHAYDPLVNLQVARGSVNPKDNVWRKYKAYMKYNTNGNRDGEYKVWINDVLWVHATNVKNKHVDNSRFFDKISFGDYTSGGGDWYLYIDNVVISDGGDTPGPILSNPQPAAPLPAGTTSTNLQITTNVNSTCRYSTTSGLDYAEMSLSLTGAGTTNHTRSITGLTNGSSTDYYIKCSRSSDGSVNTYDYPVNISVLSPQYALNISKAGTGDGTVVSSPTGINCGNTCSDGFDGNSSVVLTATPYSGSAFVSWSGCDSVLGNQCTVSMTSNKTVTVTFDSTSVSCDADHFWLCSDGPCQAVGFNYYDGACRTIPEPTDWTGLNIATNGTFTNWTQLPSGTWMPDFWNSYTPNSISNDLGACSILEGGHIYRSLPEVKSYRYVANMRVFTNDMEVWTDDQDSQYHYAADGPVRTVTGVVSYDGVGDRNIYFKAHGILDDIVIKELSINNPINGECGPVNGLTVQYISEDDLCYQGDFANLSETWPKTWDCLGYNGGTPDLGCTAYLQQQVSGISASGSFFYNTSPENNNFPYTVPFILE